LEGTAFRQIREAGLGHVLRYRFRAADRLALAYHVIRTGRSFLWIFAIAIVPPPFGWIAYGAFAILPDMWSSAPARRFADNVVNVADPGRNFREKQRQVATVGSADAKRALAKNVFAWAISPTRWNCMRAPWPVHWAPAIPRF